MFKIDKNSNIYNTYNYIFINNLNYIFKFKGDYKYNYVTLIYVTVIVQSRLICQPKVGRQYG